MSRRTRSPIRLATASLTSLLAAGLLAGGLAVAGTALGTAATVATAEPAEAACAENGGRRLSGTLQGEDGRYVWGFIGVEFFDAQGNKVDANGCREHDAAAYSAHVRVNRQMLSGHGAVGGNGLTKSWEITDVPSNVATVWMEAYPMTNHPYESISRVRYGHAMRRAVPLPARVNVKLPVRCGVDGGRTGAISGRFIVNGKPVMPEKVWAWTTDPDGGHYIMGWGMAELRHGRFRVENLAPGQHYVMWATYGGTTHKIWNIPVSACKDTRRDVVVGSDVRGKDAIAGLADVPVTSYYARPAAWALSKGITTGVGGKDYFAPRAQLTRAEMITFLWRTAGEPAARGNGGFADVPGRSYYAEAVAWARRHGITTGVGGTNRFEPNRPVTRAEVATLLWRAEPGRTRGTASGFVDVPRNTYYAAAVAWARHEGITTGVGGTNRFEPTRPLTRAEMIAMLWRAEDQPAHGRPPGAVGRSCASFTSVGRAKAFYDLYRQWGDLAGLREDGQICPLAYGSPL